MSAFTEDDQRRVAALERLALKLADIALWRLGGADLSGARDVRRELDRLAQEVTK